MGVKRAVFGWCFALYFGLMSVARAMNAELAHDLIEQQAPHLLGNGSQLTNLCFFSQSQSKAVVGLEQVGDEYLPIHWLDMMESQTVKAWYYPLVPTNQYIKCHRV